MGFNPVQTVLGHNSAEIRPIHRPLVVDRCHVVALSPPISPISLFTSDAHHHWTLLKFALFSSDFHRFITGDVHHRFVHIWLHGENHCSLSKPQSVLLNARKPRRGMLARPVRIPLVLARGFVVAPNGQGPRTHPFALLVIFADSPMLFEFERRSLTVDE